MAVFNFTVIHSKNHVWNGIQGRVALNIEPNGETVQPGTEHDMQVKISYMSSSRLYRLR
jgi:hypothetical protein